MKRSLAVVAWFALVVVMMWPAGAAHASCAPRPSTAEGLATFDSVVVGTVTATTSHRRVATVAVEDSWKGTQLARLEVLGGPDVRGDGGSTVDRTYDVGVTYLFFLRSGGSRNGDVWMDNACSPTEPYRTELAQHRPAAAQLVTPSATVAPSTVAPSVEDALSTRASTGDSSTGDSSAAPIAVVALVVGGVAAGAVVLLRRRSSPPA